MRAVLIPKCESVELPARGVELATLDFGGQGPLCLIAHANGFCAGVYAPLAERLVSRFHVIAYDHRGHGDSTKPVGEGVYAWSEFRDDLAAIAEALCVRHDAPRVELGIGHSFGGTSMLLAAAGAPGRFGRVVALDPVLFPPPEVGEAMPTRANGRPDLASGARNRRREFPSRAALIESYGAKPLFAAWAPGVLELYAEWGFRERADGSVELKCPPEVEAAIFAAGPGSIDLFAEIAVLETPSRLLHAGRGNFPRPFYDALAERSPAISIETVDAGHLLAMETPDLVVERTLAFCE